MVVRLVALVPILGLVLSGCTGSAQEPVPEPPAFTASPTPSAVALEVPPSARATDAVGAAAFARFYIEVLSDALQSGDTVELRDLSDPMCGGCNNFIGVTEDDAAAGKSLEGGAFLVDSAEATEDEGGALVDIVFTRAAGRTLDKNGEVSEQADASGSLLMQMRLVRNDESGWVTRGIRFPDVPT